VLHFVKQIPTGLLWDFTLTCVMGSLCITAWSLGCKTRAGCNAFWCVCVGGGGVCMGVGGCVGVFVWVGVCVYGCGWLCVCGRGGGVSQYIYMYVFVLFQFEAPFLKKQKSLSMESLKSKAFTKLLKKISKRKPQLAEATWSTVLTVYHPLFGKSRVEFIGTFFILKPLIIC
jgi:hypothetical protein